MLPADSVRALQQSAEVPWGSTQAEGERGSAMPRWWMLRCSGPVCGGCRRWLSRGSAKSRSKGWAGTGCCCLVLLLAPVPGGEDEPVAPGQRVPILLSGHYNNDVLEHFAQPAISWRLQMLGDRHVTGPGAARLSHPCRRPRRERAHGLAGVGMDYGGAKGFLQGGELQRCVQRDRCHQPSP